MAESTLFVFRSVLRICSYFNPRTPVGCDDFGVWRPNIVIISIHAPQWGATGTGIHPAIRQQISIHAPQWGATPNMIVFLSLFGISIHAPQWGATSPIRAEQSARHDFNPRTPVGCDDAHDGAYHAGDISIHAPQWGATRFVCWVISLITDFNPRTPVGCDLSNHASLAASS